MGNVTWSATPPASVTPPDPSDAPSTTTVSDLVRQGIGLSSPSATPTPSAAPAAQAAPVTWSPTPQAEPLGNNQVSWQDIAKIGPRTPDQAMSDSINKMALTGWMGPVTDQILKWANGGGIPKPSWMTDAQYRQAINDTVNGATQDTLAGIQARDQANPLIGGNQNVLQDVGHVGLSGLTQMADPINMVGGFGKNLITRLGTQGLIAGGANALGQGGAILEGTQKDFDPLAVGLSGAFGVGGQAAGELLHGLGSAAAKGLRDYFNSASKTAEDVKPDTSAVSWGSRPQPQQGILNPEQTGTLEGLYRTGTAQQIKDFVAGTGDTIDPDAVDKFVTGRDAAIAAGKPISDAVTYENGQAPAAPEQVPVTNDKPTEVAEVNVVGKKPVDTAVEAPGGTKEPAEAVPDVQTPETPKAAVQTPVTVTDGKLSQPFSFDQNVYDHTPEVLQHVADNLQGKSLPDAAAWMHDNSTGAMQQVFGRVQQRLSDLEDIGIKGKVSVGENEPGQAGVAYIEPREGDLGGSTRLGTGPTGPDFGVSLRDPSLHGPSEIPGTSPGVVLHELTHAATIGLTEAVRARPNAPRLQPFVRPVADLDALWSHVVEHSMLQEGAGKGASLPMAVRSGNLRAEPEELLAWGMSDPEVQSWLKTIPYKTTTAWTKFTNTVRGLLGIKPNESSAMSALLKTFDHLTGDQEAYKNAHGIFDKYGRIQREARVTPPEGEDEAPKAPKPAPEKAGSINLSRLGQLSEEGKYAIRDAARENGADSIAPVPVQQRLAKAEAMHEQAIARSARKLGPDASDYDIKEEADNSLLTRNPRLSTAPEYMDVIRGIMKRTTNDAVDAGRKVIRNLDETGKSTPEDDARLQYLQAKLGLAAARVAKVANLGGRLLNAMRTTLDKHGHGLPPGVEDTDLHTFAAIITAHNSPEAIQQAALDSMRIPHWDDYAKEAWYNMRLSGIKTHAQIFFANAGNLGASVFSHGVAAGVGAPKGLGLATNRVEAIKQARAEKLGSEDSQVFKDRVNDLQKKYQLDRVTGREVAARMYGIWRGLTNLQGYKDVRTVLNTGQPLDQASRTGEGRLVTATPSVLKLPSHAVAAHDQLWANILKASDFSGMAVRTAYREGLSGKAFADRVQQLEEAPTKEMMAHASSYSRVIQMMDDPGPLAKMLKAAQATPKEGAGTGERALRLGMNVMFPFPTITDGMFRTAMRSNPITGVFDRYNQADWKAGGARKDLVVARMMAGTAVLGFGAILAARALSGQDGITGNGPASPSARAAWLAAGHRPNSIEIGGKAYPYSGLGPLATMLSTVASMTEQQHYGELQGKNGAQKLWDAVSQMGQSFEGNEFTRGVGNFFAAFTPGAEGDAARERFVGGVIQSLYEPSILRDTVQAGDRAERDTKDPTSPMAVVGHELQSNLPSTPWTYGSRDLPQKMDIYGRPEFRDQPTVLGARLPNGASIVTPFTMSPMDKDTAIKEVSRLQAQTKSALLSPVERQITGQDSSGQTVTKHLTAQEAENYQRLAGQYILQGIHEDMKNPQWSALTDPQRVEEVRYISKLAKEQARDDLFFSSPADAQQALKFQYNENSDTQPTVQPPVTWSATPPVTWSSTPPKGLTK